MPTDLYALVYVSEAAHALADADLDALLARSREVNRRRDLTGFLSYDRDASDPADTGTFVQQLEGPSEAVLATYHQRIVPSRLHRNPRVRLEGPIRSRAFGDWSMAFARGVAPDLDASIAPAP